MPPASIVNDELSELPWPATNSIRERIAGIGIGGGKRADHGSGGLIFGDHGGGKCDIGGLGIAHGGDCRVGQGDIEESDFVDHAVEIIHAAAAVFCRADDDVARWAPT